MRMQRCKYLQGIPILSDEVNGVMHCNWAAGAYCLSSSAHASGDVCWQGRTQAGCWTQSTLPIAPHIAQAPPAAAGANQIKARPPYAADYQPDQDDALQVELGRRCSLGGRSSDGGIGAASTAASTASTQPSWLAYDGKVRGACKRQAWHSSAHASSQTRGASPDPAAGSPLALHASTRHPLTAQVLRFFMHWREEVADSPLEAWRVRRCALHFFLEDGSCELVEPRTDNSGLVQGTLLRRHRCVLYGWHAARMVLPCRLPAAQYSGQGRRPWHAPHTGPSCSKVGP